MSLELDEHRHYLLDRPRVAAYRRAIHETVRPGDVVLDLGAGTGILGMLALEAGAARVYAIDSGQMVDVGHRVARANDLHTRVTWIRDLSTRVQLPERVDAVVTDQIGRFGFDAGIVEYMRDARRRLLKPEGRMVPLGVRIHLVPVEAPELRDRVEFWTTRPAGFDFGPARLTAVNTGYPTHYSTGQFLAEPQPVAEVDLEPDGASHIAGHAVFTITRPGELDGVGAWFVARLSPSVTMSNAPTDPDRIQRRQVFLPIDRRLRVEEGTRVAVKLAIRPEGLLVSWTVTVTAPGDHPLTFRHSTLQGMLLTPQELRCQQSSWQPALTPAGLARRTLLDLCDGQRTLESIERELQRRYPELLPDYPSAAAFVGETLSVYAR